MSYLLLPCIAIAASVVLSTEAFSQSGDRCTMTPKCAAATNPVSEMANRLSASMAGASVHQSAEAAYCLNAAAAKAMKTCLAEHKASGDTECMDADNQAMALFQQTAAEAKSQAQDSYGGTGAYKPACGGY
jgi:hypothetical protein